MKRIQVYLRLVRDITLCPILLIFPKNNHKILFGAWFGRQLVGSPKYLLKYLLEQGGYECVWVGEEIIRERAREDFPSVKFVRKGSWAALWHYLRSRFVVCNIDLESDIIRFPHFQRIIQINTTHGGVNKRCGVTMLQGDGSMIKRRVPKNIIRKCLFNMISSFAAYAYGHRCWGSASSIEQRNLILHTYPGRYTEETLLTKGSPCIDFLVNNKNNLSLIASLKAKYARLFGISPDKRWYIYVPTWRHSDGVPFSFTKSNKFSEYNTVLRSQEAILIDKEHPKTLERTQMTAGLYENIYVVSPKMSLNIDIQELLLVCDRLISDYSTIYMDYGVLHRPIIEYTFDYEYVRTKEFGLEYDLREYAPGPFAYNEDELIHLLMLSDEDLLRSRKDKFDAQLECEEGQSCQAYLSLIQKLGE